MTRNYYEAYDDRYRQIHSQNLQWFYDDPTPIVQNVMEKYCITKDHKLLELGCGEGRDACPLLKQGYNLLATDISPAAIQYAQKKWPEYSDHFEVLDCISGEIAQKFHFIYAVAVVHMLVLDEDRDGFYCFLRDHLNEGGLALVCSMGDGEFEMKSDISTAFTLQERSHPSGKIMVAGTSCRMVSFPTFEAEFQRNGLRIVEKGLTEAMPDFNSLLYAVVTRKS